MNIGRIVGITFLTFGVLSALSLATLCFINILKPLPVNGDALAGSVGFSFIFMVVGGLLAEANKN